jgi:hypothetical protein
VPALTLERLPAYVSLRWRLRTIHGRFREAAPWRTVDVTRNDFCLAPRTSGSAGASEHLLKNDNSRLLLRHPVVESRPR